MLTGWWPEEYEGGAGDVGVVLPMHGVLARAGLYNGHFFNYGLCVAVRERLN